MVYGILNRCNRWIANIHNCDSIRRSIILLNIDKVGVIYYEVE